MPAPDPLAPIERWLIKALAALSPEARKTALNDIGREMRKRNQKRIGKELGPDGKIWPDRKRDAMGHVRSNARMLQGLREVRRMALKATPAGMELGYSGRNGRLAAVHQHGEVDAVEQDGPKVKYPSRPLLGLTPEDIAFVREKLFEAVGKALG